MKKKAKKNEEKNEIRYIKLLLKVKVIDFPDKQVFVIDQDTFEKRLKALRKKRLL